MLGRANTGRPKIEILYIDPNRNFCIRQGQL
jgi:hypothetical protein